MTGDEGTRHSDPRRILSIVIRALPVSVWESIGRYNSATAWAIPATGGSGLSRNP
jgi:hypothetical protein